MNNLKIVFCNFFFIVFFCVMMDAQHVVKVPNIDLIAYDHESFMLYEKVGEDAFKAVDIDFNSHKHGRRSSKIHIDRDDYTYTQAEINREYEKFVTVNQLKPNGFNDLKHTEWEIKAEDIEEEEHAILKFSDQNFATYYDLEAVEEYRHPEQSQWDVFYAVWYQPVILDFGNDKQIILLNDDSNIDFTIIPINDRQNPLVLSEDEKILEIIPIQKNKYFITQKDEFYEFYFSQLYQKIKDGNQFRIFDHYGNDLLGIAFDTITDNEYYIVGKKDDEYTVYTSLLKKIDIPNLKKVHLHNDELEILTTNGPAYYNYLGENSGTTHVKSIVCGTVNDIKYELLHNTNNRYNHSIKIAHGGLARTYHQTREFVFTNIKNKSNVTFLDNTTHKYWDENKGRQSKYPEYIKVQTNNSYGLFSYDYEMDDQNSIRDTITNGIQKKIIHKTPKLISAKKELSIKYDDIKIYESRILFYKNNKIGIFPHHKKPRYELLEIDTGIFFKIIKNGKSGWLDIVTMEEFFFN